MPKCFTENEKRLVNLPTMQDFEEVFNTILLTERQRKVFELYYRDGWRMIDIACELDVSERTISAEHTAILKKLNQINF